VLDRNLDLRSVLSEHHRTRCDCGLRRGFERRARIGRTRGMREGRGDVSEAGGARGGCVGVGNHLALHARLGEAHSTAARALPHPSASAAFAAHAAAAAAPPGSPSRAAATLRAGTGGTAIAAKSVVRRAVGSGRGVAAGKERNAREAAHLDRNQCQSVAIGVTPRHSATLSSTQQHSAALSSTQQHSAALRRTQTHSDALSSTQQHSDALRRTQTHSDALSSTQTAHRDSKKVEHVRDQVLVLQAHTIGHGPALQLVVDSHDGAVHQEVPTAHVHLRRCA